MPNFFIEAQLLLQLFIRKAVFFSLQKNNYENKKNKRIIQ